MLQHDVLGPELPVETGPITEAEVTAAGKKLRWNKACGKDALPPEFWKTITQQGSKACRWALELCRRCWDEGHVPNEWHEALVVAIFKKGDTAECSNYRPISLLPIGYKLFVSILLSRLKKGGAEQRIWPTQFGFSFGCSTRDALFLARRLIEETWAQRDATLVLLALDWAKAFDTISPEYLLQALRRFGLPEKMLQMIKAIYTNRTFSVKDAGAISAASTQHFGIQRRPYWIRAVPTHWRSSC